MGFMGGRPKGREEAPIRPTTELPAGRLDQLMTFVEKASPIQLTVPSQPRADEPVPETPVLAPAPPAPVAAVEFPDPILMPLPRTSGSHAAAAPAVEVPVIAAVGGKRRLEVAASA